MKRARFFLVALVLVFAGVAQAQSTVVLLAEDFDDLPLGTSVEESAGTENVWTDTPPAGWFVDESGVPGIGDLATDGVTEWAGWAFADKEFWINTDGQRREEFTLGEGTVAVADCDEWDDASHPGPNSQDPYDTWLSTLPIDLSTTKAGTVQLTFDSSWRPEYDSDYRQTGNLTVSFDGAEPIELFLWESNSASPNFKDDNSTNETIVVDIDNPPNAMSMVLTFGLFDAGNDWWWAIDNIVVIGERSPERAFNPHPASGAEEVSVKTVLSWTPGEYVGGLSPKHRLLLSDDLSAVEDGTAVISTQDANSYDATGLLDFGTTYYWRIDEANSVSGWDEGVVWRFTTEQLAYPIEGVLASSNATSDEGVGPERTVDGSGLNAMDEHSTVSSDMWLGIPAGADPVTIQYAFDQVYKLHEMLLWNYNVQFELVLGFGLKDVTVEYSTDGENWDVLGDVELAQATGKSDYTANTTIAFNGVPAQSVRLTVNSGYGLLNQFGLSEVRFMFIPAHARDPQPADGETEVPVDAALSWRPGREAAAHDVYLGTDPEALALVDSVSEATYTPDAVEFGNVYYWKIDEVNEADETSVWPGALWSFTLEEFALIDGFEEYDDEENRIYDTWLDGFFNGTGATVGYFEAPFAEQTTVNSGRQSMPLEYVNDAAPFYSEAELDLGSADWTTNGADTLRLFVAGQAPAFFETADGSILMNAIGTDIWDSADEFRYAYKNLTGNGSMIARVDALDGTPSGWAKAGVMVRQSTAGGSTHSFMCMTGGDGNGASWQGRLTDNASSENADATSAVAPPYWVRIDRAGDSLTGFISPDGDTWTQLGDPRSIAMTDPVLIGLALTSHNAAMATSAAFSNVSFTGNVTGDWQIAEVGVAQPEGNTPEPLYVAVEDTSGNVAVVTNPDSSATGRSGWTEWLIPHTDLAGVNLSRVAILYIGVGDRDNPSAGGTGLIFIDDVGYGHPAPAE
ncbi:MAG: discoidin domain-containing protein [Planctomycetota bacterium]|jgi:hypothetical protein